MTLTSFFQEIFRTFLYRVSLDRRTLLTIHDPGLRLVSSDGTEKGILGFLGFLPNGIIMGFAYNLCAFLDNPDHPTSILNLNKLGLAVEKIFFGPNASTTVSKARNRSLKFPLSL